MENGLKDQFIDILREYISTEGLKQKTLSKMIDRGEAYTSSLLRGKENISADRMDEIMSRIGLKLSIYAEDDVEEDN